MKLTISVFLMLVACLAKAQLLGWTPDFIKETDGSIVITMDASYGNKGLLNYADANAVYVHTGVITTKSTSAADWKYSKFTWGIADANAKATSLGNNKWSFVISSNLRSFYNLTDPTETILKIAILFRDATGSSVQRNADGSDMFIPVYDANLNISLTLPVKQPTFYPTPEPIVKNVGDQIDIAAKSSLLSDLTLYFNGVKVGNSVSGGTTISGNTTIASAGKEVIVAEASAGVNVKRDTISFFVTPANVIAALPPGVRDGINYDPNDPTKVTLVLYAPNKSNARLIGDFTNWNDDINYQMNKTPDGLRYWLTIAGLKPGVEYGYQYIIDNALRVGDIFCEKILDPGNDKYINPGSYPNLKIYPEGKTTGLVSIFQTARSGYGWQVQNFNRPNKSNLVIYELLIRDFVATQRFKTVKDSLPYLRKLGVSAIELLPVNEFEGNNSWGYNPDYFFAVDKNYGTEEDFKAFIDECHKNGIAVIMDIAMNHAFGQSPTVQMYWNSATQKPAANNPWHNVDPTHPFNVGYDFNHEAPATIYLVNRVVEHWLKNYKIDGFRWDLSKGFTQTNSGTDVNLWGQYDQGRVNTWKRIYDTMQSVSPGSYCILEHFAANDEEIVLSDYGMLLWGNGNHDFNEATMGWVGTSNFQYSIFTNRGWNQPNLVSYMESHDEERLMYKNYQFGNSDPGPPPYSTKSNATALKRMAMATSFWAMTPAPKMLWQFGELGYDSTIFFCEDGTINTSDDAIPGDCRTNPKPIKWNYLTATNRKFLYDTYSKLLSLRKVSNFGSTFTSNQIGYNLGSAFKWLQVTNDSLNICVIGNFDVIPQTASVTFQNAGAWYPYVKGGTQFDASSTFNATGGAQNFTLAAGEYYVFLNRDVSALIPATYTFIGDGNWSIAANWSGNKIPPAVLPNGSDIVINPTAAGSCILNIQQTISPGGKLSVLPGKNFVIQANFSVK